VKYLLALGNILARIEGVILAMNLLTMLLVAAFQVAMRNFFDLGFIWADILVRILVLWVGLMGASLATHQSRHLSIDVVTKFMPKRAAQLLKLLVRIFALVVCILLAQASWDYIIMQQESGEASLFGMPIWITEVVIPVAFILIATHFSIHIIHGCAAFLCGEEFAESEQNPL
jgi:TRAP-type C4-dicarboxylate transport system permease small subunit